MKRQRSSQGVGEERVEGAILSSAVGYRYRALI